MGMVAAAALTLAGCASNDDVIAVADEEDLAIAEITNVDQIMQITGAESPNQTDQYMVHGTDLGSMFEHDGKLYLLFGDTFGPRPVGHTGGGGSLWRSNTMAYTADTDPRDGLTIDGMIVNSAGGARDLIRSPHSGGEVTKIPTHGISVDGTIYVFFMSVAQWGEAGHWTCNFSGVAKSTDDGRTFEVIDGLQWPGESGFIQVSIVDVDGMLYFWTIPAGRFGPARLMRVSSTQIEDLEAYEYFSGLQRGSPTWSTAIEDASPLVEAPVGELSVMWNEYAGRWTMTYLNESSHAIELREATDPWGPWSPPLRVASATRYPALYGAYMHPWLTEENGRVFYFTMSQWLPYNVFLMRAEVELR